MWKRSANGTRLEVEKGSIVRRRMHTKLIGMLLGRNVGYNEETRTWD